MVVVETFGERLISMRESVGFNERKSFARHIEISETILWQLETGKGLPFHQRSDAVRKKIAAGLTANVVDLDKLSKSLPLPPITMFAPRPADEPPASRPAGMFDKPHLAGDPIEELEREAQRLFKAGEYLKAGQVHMQIAGVLNERWRKVAAKRKKKEGEK